MPASADPDPKKFETNFRILEQLAQDLEKETIPIDDLITRAQQGAVAAQACKEVLARSEAALLEIDRVYDEILKDGTGAPKA
jgi:exodeoxyribonuclease VII small subunit